MSEAAKTIVNCYIGGSKTLERVIKSLGLNAIVDSGFDGFGVVGASTLSWFRREFGVRTVVCNDGETREYSFGGGGCKSVKRRTVQIWVGNQRVNSDIDVVPGWIPLLLGQQVRVRGPNPPSEGPPRHAMLRVRVPKALHTPARPARRRSGPALA